MRARAERAGIASHLTSLVLVDEAAIVQEGIPAMRKVRLPSPRTLSVMAALSASPPDEYFADLVAEPIEWLSLPRSMDRLSTTVAEDIDWEVAPSRLLDGDLSSLDAALAERLREVAQQPRVLLWANELNVRPMALVIAVLAYHHRDQSRTAERIAWKVFRDQTPRGWRSLRRLSPT